MILIAVAENGVFGFHPDYTKAAGDLVSNLYEEFVYRGLMFCAFYGLASGASFGTNPSLSNWGIIAGTIGSCAVFGFAHEQYNLDLRIFIGIASIAFVYPWVKTRTLWAPWLAHMVVDLIGDTFIEL